MFTTEIITASMTRQLRIIIVTPTRNSKVKVFITQSDNKIEAIFHHFICYKHYKEQFCVLVAKLWVS